MNGRSRGFSVRTLALVAFCGVAWYSTRLPPPPIGVVIITLDTTRADRLSPYGYMDVSMPHLERLAREGIVFDQATTVAPLTLPAHSSLFTGLFPPRHGVHDNADEPLASRHATLAELLRAQGFRTAAFVGSVVLGPDRGLSQGFDHYGGVRTDSRAPVSPGGRHASRQRRADEVIGDSIDWLDSLSGSRFFLWTHLYDPHRPYDPPEPYRSMYDPYIGELVFADSQIGRLLAALESRDLLDRTIVIVVGDHGESLGDHGERDHGIFVYESVLRVPLIIRLPGDVPSKPAPDVSHRVGSVVRLVDVMPTVLDLMGLPTPPMDGVSLSDLIAGKRQTLGLHAFAESLYPQRFGWSSLRTVRDDRFKLIEAPRPELYDLDRDPFEQQNIYSERTRLARVMAGRLHAFDLKTSGGTDDVPDEKKVPAELRERLAALGYAGSQRAEAASPSEPLPDPKDCIALFSPGHDSADARPVPEMGRCG